MAHGAMTQWDPVDILQAHSRTHHAPTGYKKIGYFDITSFVSSSSIKAQLNDEGGVMSATDINQDRQRATRAAG
ncbi:MAG: hypothetical protein P1S60_14075, partial [Anaerolineae bacterium]|nr:hypothetical protein [Anaerolineae bacterium]